MNSSPKSLFSLSMASESRSGIPVLSPVPKSHIPVMKPSFLNFKTIPKNNSVINQTTQSVSKTNVVSAFSLTKNSSFVISRSQSSSFPRHLSVPAEIKTKSDDEVRFQHLENIESYLYDSQIQFNLQDLDLRPLGTKINSLFAQLLLSLNHKQKPTAETFYFLFNNFCSNNLQQQDLIYLKTKSYFPMPSKIYLRFIGYVSLMVTRYFRPSYQLLTSNNTFKEDTKFEKTDDMDQHDRDKLIEIIITHIHSSQLSEATFMMRKFKIDADDIYQILQTKIQNFQIELNFINLVGFLFLY